MTPRTEAGRALLHAMRFHYPDEQVAAWRKEIEAVEHEAAALDVERLARELKFRYGDAAFGIASGNLSLDRFRSDAESIIARLAAESTLRVDPHRFVDGVCPTCHYSDRVSHMTAHDARLAAEPSE